jgi:spore germination protein KB
MKGMKLIMKDKLQFFEIFSLIYFAIRASFIGIGINSVLFYGKVDSYISIIISLVLGLIPIIIFNLVTNINKNENIHNIIMSVLGNKVGKIVCFLLLCFVFFYATVLFYDVINFVASEYLYKTPSYIIGTMMIIPVIYLLIHDIKTICRTSIILFFISIIFYLFSIIGLIPSFEITNLLPILENGISSPLMGTIQAIAYTSLPIFILTIIPKNSVNGKNIFKKVVITYLLISLIICITVINVIGILGIDLALLYQYPDYQVLRRIQVGGFIQRTESILAIQWLLCLFVMISFCLYYVIKTTSIIFPKLNNKVRLMLPYIYPIIMLILCRTIWRNNTIFVNFTIKQFPIYLYIFLLVIPIIILLVYYIKKLKNKFS